MIKPVAVVAIGVIGRLENASESSRDEFECCRKAWNPRLTSVVCLLDLLD